MFEIHPDGVRHDKYIWIDGADSIKRWEYDIRDIKNELSSLSGMDDVIVSLSVLEDEMSVETILLEKIGESIAAITNEYDETEEIIIDDINSLQYRAFDRTMQIRHFEIDEPNRYGRVDQTVMSELLQLIS